MKKFWFPIAFLATIAAAIYLIVKFFLWYLLGCVVVAIIMFTIEKPVLLEPDDPRFGD